MAAQRSTRAKPRCFRRLFGKSKYDLSFLCPDWLEYSSIDKMTKYDWNTFRNYVAFLADEMASGTMHPHHDSELISWYHDAFLPWDHYLNNIVLFYHDSPITRSHFMDPTDCAIKGFYCTFGILNVAAKWFDMLKIDLTFCLQMVLTPAGQWGYLCILPDVKCYCYYLLQGSFWIWDQPMRDAVTL